MTVRNEEVDLKIKRYSGNGKCSCSKFLNSVSKFTGRCDTAVITMAEGENKLENMGDE